MRRKPVWGAALALAACCALAAMRAGRGTDENERRRVADVAPGAQPLQRSAVHPVPPRTRATGAQLLARLLLEANAQPRQEAPALLAPGEAPPALRAEPEPPPPPPPAADPGEVLQPSVQSRWQLEQEDAALSARVSRHVGTLLEDLHIEGSLLRASCRVTVCKLELRFASMEQAAELRAGTGDEDLALAIDLKEDGDGLTADVYLPRDSHAL